MSSAFALAFSHSLSSSKELGGLFWSLTAVLHVVSVVFAPGADLSTSSVVVNRGFEATTPVVPVVIPSACASAPGALSHPYVAAMVYAAVVFISVFGIFLAKGSCSSVQSPNGGSPSPNAPVPDGTSSLSALEDPASMNGHDSTAADEAPPPPPPDDGPGVTNKPDGCKKPFGWLVWLWWLILHVFKWLYKIPCIALQTAFKIIWVYTGPVFWMGVKYYIPPVFILQTINLFGLGPPVASYSGPYVFKTAMYLLNGNMASTILTVISTWVFVYPFFKFGFNLLLDINTYLCLSPALLRWILFSPVQFIRAWLRAANTIRRWTVAFYRRLPDGYGTVHCVMIPLLVLSCIHWQWSNILGLSIKWLHGLVDFHDFCNGLATLILNTPKLLWNENSHLHQTWENMVLCWEWLIVPTVNRLSALQIYSLFFPPVLHVIYTDMYSDARCIRMVEYKLYKRIAELETRLENVAR